MMSFMRELAIRSNVIYNHSYVGDFVDLLLHLNLFNIHFKFPVCQKIRWLIG
jgi:hypothetical protein